MRNQLSVQEETNLGISASKIKYLKIEKVNIVLESHIKDKKRVRKVQERKMMICQTCKLVRKIHAHSLCSTCYYNPQRNQQGSKAAYGCQHLGTRLHYSRGMCRACYFRSHYLSRKGTGKAQKEEVKDDSAVVLAT
jgi:hypothetical protein